MAFLAGQILRASDLEGILPVPTAYVPVNTGITVGNGVQVAKYMRIGDMVHVDWVLTCGTTTAFTTFIKVGLPFEADGNVCLNGTARDFGNAQWMIAGVANAGATAVDGRFHGAGAAVGQITTNSPFTPGDNDTYRLSGAYEAVPL